MASPRREAYAGHGEYPPTKRTGRRATRHRFCSVVQRLSGGPGWPRSQETTKNCGRIEATQRPRLTKLHNQLQPGREQCHRRQYCWAWPPALSRFPQSPTPPKCDRAVMLAGAAALTTVAAANMRIEAVLHSHLTIFQRNDHGRLRAIKKHQTLCRLLRRLGRR